MAVIAENVTLNSMVLSVFDGLGRLLGKTDSKDRPTIDQNIYLSEPNAVLFVLRT